MIATIGIRNRVSRRDLVELAREPFGVELSTGAVDAIVQRAGASLEFPYLDLHRHSVPRRPSTSTRPAGGSRALCRTLWGAFTDELALLRIALDRHERELVALLGEKFKGTCCSDRWWAYNRPAPRKRQVSLVAPDPATPPRTPKEWLPRKSSAR